MTYEVLVVPLERRTPNDMTVRGSRYVLSHDILVSLLSLSDKPVVKHRISEVSRKDIVCTGISYH